MKRGNRLTCAACAVARMYAPPATVFLQLAQCQMPTTVRLTLSLPQKTHVYFECWLTSIFLTTLRSEEPYRTPYLPVIPAFLVRCGAGGVAAKASSGECARRAKARAGQKGERRGACAGGDAPC